MLEDTNSLDGAQMLIMPKSKQYYAILKFMSNV